MHHTGDGSLEWQSLYDYGASHQLYGIDLRMFRGIGFGILVEHLAKTYGFILLAVEEGSTGLILRNPGLHIYSLTLTLTLTITRIKESWASYLFPNLNPDPNHNPN